MLDQCVVVGFIPTRDAARARAFYVDLLGLPVVTEDSFATEVAANGTHIRIVNAPEFTPLPMTLLGWQVPDILTAVQTLSARGIVFERYGWSQQDADAIWTAPDGTRVAWFRDPDGNTLSVSQH